MILVNCFFFTAEGKIHLLFKKAESTVVVSAPGENMETGILETWKTCCI